MAKAIKLCEIAEEFVQHQDFADDLAYCFGHDTFYLWNDYYYKKLNDDEFTIEVRLFVRTKFPTFNVTTNTLRDIINQVKMICNLRVENTNQKFAALKDRYLNLETFETLPTDKEKLVAFSFPYTSEELHTTTTKNFNHFLSSSLTKEEDNKKTDEDLVDYVQEMFGFFLLANLNSAGAFFLLGNGANGKSILTYILQEMFTPEYYSAMSIQDMTTDKFAGVNLIGKKINISNEEESKYLRSDKFKAMITGNPIKMEYKFGKSFMYAPRTKYIFASNELPTFEGLNYGVRRRIKIIPFFRMFKDDDPDIIPESLMQSRLQVELPGIINWAIQGAKKFVKNNYVFNVPKASKKALKVFEEDMSSSVQFVRTHYNVSKEQWIANDDIYEEYKFWCHKNGRKSVASARFHKEVLATVEGLKAESKYNNKSGRTMRCKNLELITNVPQKVDVTNTDNLGEVF